MSGTKPLPNGNTSTAYIVAKWKAENIPLELTMAEVNLLHRPELITTRADLLATFHGRRPSEVEQTLLDRLDQAIAFWELEYGTA